MKNIHSSLKVSDFSLVAFDCIEVHQQERLSVVTCTPTQIDWEGVRKTFDQKTVDMKTKIKEAIHIRRQRPTLNRDGGYELPASYDHLLSRD